MGSPCTLNRNDSPFNTIVQSGPKVQKITCRESRLYDIILVVYEVLYYLTLSYNEKLDETSISAGENFQVIWVGPTQPTQTKQNRILPASCFNTGCP